MPDSPLVIENLSFRYPDRKGAAIQNISFEVKPGEILLIAGASGCGKTTLIRCINGLIPRSYKGEMRFIPTFGRDFQLTMDAQRARGYELEKLSGGPIEQVRKMGPIFVPVTIHAIIGSEDIIDAMELRAFGIGPRTWLEVLERDFKDRLLIWFGVAILVGSTLLGLMGYGQSEPPHHGLAGSLRGGVVHFFGKTMELPSTNRGTNARMDGSKFVYSCKIRGRVSFPEISNHTL